jgi:hypothetical protein
LYNIIKYWSQSEGKEYQPTVSTLGYIFKRFRSLKNATPCGSSREQIALHEDPQGATSQVGIIFIF